MLYLLRDLQTGDLCPHPGLAKQPKAPPCPAPIPSGAPTLFPNPLELIYPPEIGVLPLKM